MSNELSPMLNCEDVAALLRKSKWVVQSMAKKGKLPGARRLGREWRFQRNAIQRFVYGN
jgi:excisionase family DNA binding protein